MRRGGIHSTTGGVKREAEASLIAAIVAAPGEAAHHQIDAPVGARRRSQCLGCAAYPCLMFLEGREDSRITGEDVDPGRESSACFLGKAIKLKRVDVTGGQLPYLALAGENRRSGGVQQQQHFAKGHRFRGLGDESHIFGPRSQINKARPVDLNPVESRPDLSGPVSFHTQLPCQIPPDRDRPA